MKIKAGLLVGYNGRGYHGLQLNGELETVEKAIAEGLLAVHAVSERNAADPSKIHLKSSSRTDKGVHAALNLVAANIELPVTEDLVASLREQLVERNIHLYRIIRLTKSVLPSKQAEFRIYEYVVPTFFLREGDFNREVEAMEAEDLKGQSGVRRTYTEDTIGQVAGYTSSAEDRGAFCSILQRYIGTKNFHNFTNLSNAKGARRYIKEIHVSDPYVCDGVEYVAVSISGQSFLLHQIRKMILFAVLLCRYSRQNVDAKFQRALGGEAMHIPKSPAEYLFLDKPVFRKLRREGGQEEIAVEDGERSEYKKAVIYPQIHRRENLAAFFASLDSVRFHRSNMLFLDDIVLEKQ